MEKSKIQVSFISLLVVMIILLYSCDVTNPTAQIYVSDFPNKIGNEWTYYYYDSLNFISDTVNVKIVRDTTIAVDRIAMIWKYMFRNSIKYELVETYHDSVIFYMNTPDYLLEYYKIVFPLSIGNKWENSNSQDSSMVRIRKAISISAGDYWNCYLIDREWWYNNGFLVANTWFIPNLGVVKEHNISNSKNNYWELMEWNLK